jgi:RNA polymerase sigma-70 factor (ECF subfamily)
MDDSQIIALYFRRSEDAIAETEKKYGKYCHYIAYNILYSPADAEECVNDTYMKAWQSIPPQKPENLSAFLGTITRNIALNRYVRDRAKKRSAGTEVVFEEAEELRSPSGGESFADELALREAINSFAASLTKETRIIFVRRYWYLSPINDIARDYGIPQGTVKSILSRTRKRLRKYLLKEGFTV